MNTPQPNLRTRRRPLRRHNRRGGAAVEFALISPVLIVLVLGIVDVGQYINVGQNVSNASRGGARLAVRAGTTNVSDVESFVVDYLADSYPGVSRSVLDGATNVTVRDSSGAQITSDGLSTVATGSKVNVEVVVQFDPIRWISGFSYLGGKSLTTETAMRRE